MKKGWSGETLLGHTHESILMEDMAFSLLLCEILFSLANMGRSFGREGRWSKACFSFFF